MRGRLKYENWYVSDVGLGSFMAERTVNGKREFEYLSAHCLACAKADILAQCGGKVDLRGWHRQGNCGVWLVAMQTTVNLEEGNF